MLDLSYPGFITPLVEIIRPAIEKMRASFMSYNFYISIKGCICRTKMKLRIDR
jgi:hypothetical protein